MINWVTRDLEYKIVVTLYNANQSKLRSIIPINQILMVQNENNIKLKKKMTLVNLDWWLVVCHGSGQIFIT